MVVVGVAAVLQVFMIIVVEVLPLHYEFFFYYCGSIAAAFKTCLSVKVSGIVHSKR